jgi:hypothetical protein
MKIISRKRSDFITWKLLAIEYFDGTVRASPAVWASQAKIPRYLALDG